MENGKSNDGLTRFRRSIAEHDSSWGSLNDSDLNSMLQDDPKSRLETNIDTDVDTDDDNKKPTEVPKSISDDWGSMNDSQFISFVNRISQTQRQKNQSNNATVIINQSSDKIVANDTVPLDPVFSTPVKQLKSANAITSSPILFAQKLDSFEPEENFIGIQQDVLTKQDVEDSENFAFNDHGGYFKMKTAKQDRQNQELSEFLKGASNDDTISYPPLFSNCAIHINGRTEPDILQLRKMIVLHGGKYVHYLSSTGAATHIIAVSLPPRKRIQFSNCKVVHPKWIVESIEQKKLLNWADYRLEQLGDYGQKQIQFEKKIVEPQVDEGEVQEVVNTEVKENVDPKDDILSQELGKAGVDAKHPDFLRIFFSKSRLHHLSTWKSDLRSEFLNKAISILKERKAAESQPPDSQDKVIIHVDFDCFFATVSAKLHDPPIDISTVPCCVTHGGASADISSCNYVARKYGVSNGMWFSKAKQLCPNIICLPYQFDEYERISNIFYDKLLSMDIDSILPVSIDEALVDISTMRAKSGSISEIVCKIKSELDGSTGCTVSCGCGNNVLMAKLALRKAKPNGVYLVPNEDHERILFLNSIDVKTLPGFGSRLYDKLRDLIGYKSDEVVTLEVLRGIEKEKLVSTFGIKMGEKLYEYSRGNDETSIDLLSDPDKYLRKSIGIDINWGIRFNTNSEVEDFLNRLAGELSKRLIDCGMIGSNLTLKLSIRHPDAPIEPAKYLGMGYCNFVSKSSRLGVSTRVQGVLGSEMKYLWRFLNVEPVKLRGVGVSMTKLIPEKVGKLDTDNQMKLEFKSRTKKETTGVSEMSILNVLPVLEPKTTTTTRIVKSEKRNADFLGEEIDWEVFDNLPVELQDEIKGELRRRRLQTSPKKKKMFNSGKDIAVMLSPSKQTPNRTPVKDDVFKLTPQKISERADHGLSFQGIKISKEEEILSKLITWMDFTLDSDAGINERDLELFMQFMTELITTRDFLHYDRIVKGMTFHLGLNKEKAGYAKWLNEIEHLQAQLDEQSFTDFEFGF